MVVKGLWWKRCRYYFSFHLRPEFWGDMLGDQGVGGLDFREVRHCGVGLQQCKIELGKKLWMLDFSRVLIGCGC